MLIQLIQNASLLVTLTMLYGLLVRLRKNRIVLNKTLIGLLFGLIAIAGMNMPFTQQPGIFYDGRSIILTLAGLFGGNLAGVIAILVASAFRIIIGGTGIWAGVATIICCTLIGLYFRKRYNNQPVKIRFHVLLGIGFITHFVMLGCQLLLPWPDAFQIIQIIWLPVLTVFPFTFMIRKIKI